MVAVGHAKDPFTFTYINFLYAFSPTFPYAVLGWVPLELGARVTMGMYVTSCPSMVMPWLSCACSADLFGIRCLQPLDDGRSLLLSFGHRDSSMRLAVYATAAALHTMLRV